MPDLRVSQTHCLCQGVVCFEVVVCVSGLTSGAAVTCQAQNSGADRRPLCLSQGNGAEVKGKNVGAGHRCRLI